MIRLENVLKIPLQDFLKTSWRCLEDVFARTLEDVLTKSWRCLEDVLARRLEDVLKTSWRRIAKTNILVLTKTSWRRLEDVFWRRKAKANIFVLIKTSWRRLLKTKTKDVFKTSSKRLHQDECLVGSLRDFLKMSWICFCKTSWRRFEDVFKTSCQNVLKMS